MKSYRIFGASEVYARKQEDINPNISTHIAQTSKNTYLPPNYEKDIAVGKPEWWISKFLKGSFNFSEGAVYPNLAQNIVDISPDEIRHNVKTKGWKVVAGADFGLKDPTTLLLVAIDPVNGVVYAYDEYYRNQLPVAHHAREMKRRMEHIPLGSLQTLVGDPSGKRRNINDTRSIFDHYAEYGIFFEPGDNRIDAGIMKVYSYLEMGKFKILRHMTNTIEEMTNYHYKPVELDETPDEKPADGEDHMCDTIRYVLKTLPDDPDMLKSQTYGLSDFRASNPQEHLPFELQDNQENYHSYDYMNY